MTQTTQQVLPDPAKTLTQRQAEFIALMASGYSYEAVAEAKFVHYRTVVNTIKLARVNCCAENVTHLCILALDAGVIVKNGVGFKPVIDPTVLD